MPRTPQPRDAQLLEKQSQLLAQSAMLRQRARHQTATVLEPFAHIQNSIRWVHQANARKALWVLIAATLLFGKTRPVGLQALRLWRYWRLVRRWFKP